MFRWLRGAPPLNRSFTPFLFSVLDCEAFKVLHTSRKGSQRLRFVRMSAFLLNYRSSAFLFIVGVWCVLVMLSFRFCLPTFAPPSEEALLRDVRSRVGFADPKVRAQVC